MIKINPYIKTLLKENIFYLLSSLFLFVLIIFSFIIGLNKLQDKNKKISLLQDDIQKLEKKIDFFQNKTPDKEKLDSDLKVLNKLIPNSEDYFSIIYALEKISQDTGFLITSYNINVLQSTSEKILLKVRGEGDTSSFLKFLDSYNFSGGRLITSDKIFLNQENQNLIEINLAFYNKKTDLSPQEIIAPSEKIFTEIEKIKEKISFDIVNQNNEELIDYPKKSTLF